MSQIESIPDIGWEEVGKKFFALVLKSPIAIVTMTMSFFLGYGISFVIFDYRKNSIKKAHYLFHLLIGLSYSAFMFLIVNYNKVSFEMTEEDFSKSMPLTLLVSFAVAFIVIITISIIRETKRPYSNE